MKIVASAPGKLMLLGEHAVVYGYPCIVMAVDKRISVEMEFIDEASDRIETPQVTDARFVIETVRIFKERYSLTKNIHVKTQGDFSHQVGLGSSSAVTVATCAALARLFSITLTKRQIFDISFAVTHAIQTVGSGFDIAAAIWGGTLYFVAEAKVIDELPLQQSPSVVGYSGTKADTTQMVKAVSKKYATKKNEMNILFQNIQTLVENGRRAIIKNDMEKLGETMTQNHILLKQLGVSTEKLDAMVDAALSAGAYGAKLSGAGGGDCIIALVSENTRTAVESAIRKTGGEIISVATNTSGVEVKVT